MDSWDMVAVLKYTRCPKCSKIMEFGTPLDNPTEEAVADVLAGKFGEYVCWRCRSVYNRYERGKLNGR